MDCTDMDESWSLSRVSCTSQAQRAAYMYMFTDTPIFVPPGLVCERENFTLTQRSVDIPGVCDFLTSDPTFVLLS